MRILTSGVAAFAILMCLGGCSVLSTLHLARASSRGSTALGGDAPVQLSATDLGRENVAAGRFGLAAEFFQRALATGEPAAPALNGLGVVYAQIGRFDSARMLFQRAASLDPANEKYTSNLALLESAQMEHSAASNAKEAEVVAAAVGAVAAAPRTSASGGIASASLTQAGPREFHVRSASSTFETAPALAVISRHNRTQGNVPASNSDETEVAERKQVSRLVANPHFKALVRFELPPLQRASGKSSAIAKRG